METTGINFEALGGCFAEMCKDMLDENCSKCDSVLDCILYPRCCLAAGVKFTPEDSMGWELTLFLVETDGVEEEDDVELDSETVLTYDFNGLTPDDTTALWTCLQTCRSTQIEYKESIEKLLNMIWIGVSGEESIEAPFPHEVPDFLELAQYYEEEEDD